MRESRIHTLTMQHPADVSALAAALAAGEIDPAGIVCILVKTEGNGLDNDFTRTMATDAIAALLAPTAADLEKISLIASGGCEGFVTPHMTVFSTAAGGRATPGRARLALGRALSRVMTPAEIGTAAQAMATHDALLAAMASAGLTRTEVAFVEVKCALLSGAPNFGKPRSRAASALGVALALGEIAAADIAASRIGEDRSLYTRHGSITAGNTNMQNEVVVFGNSAGWSGELAVASACFADMLDAGALQQALRQLGLMGSPQLTANERGRLAAIIVKAEPRADGVIRGDRTVMRQDGDMQTPRHYRAAMGGMLATLTGGMRHFIGYGAEHQGPEGGGNAAVFARLESKEK